MASDLERMRGTEGRPSSSYGSMRSDEEEEEDRESDSSFTLSPHFGATPAATGLQPINRYPETLFTQSTQHTKPPDAFIIETSYDIEVESEVEEEEEEEEYISGELNSPEPPSPVDNGDQMEDEEAGPDRLHPELNMPHIFMNMRNVLSGLSVEDKANFTTRLCLEEKRFNLEELLQLDELDLVDKMIEELGPDDALKLTINGLESIKKITEARDLEDKCKRVTLHAQLKQHILRRFKVLYEGVPRPGKQQLLDRVYVQPEISRRDGVGHHHPPSDSGADHDDVHVHVRDLVRLRGAGGEPARTLVTTGLPGIGLSVVAARFCMEWAEGGANKDIQFVIPLSFENLVSIQKFHLPPSKKMSIMEVIDHYYQGFGDGKYLGEQDCRFLLLMDSFDFYPDPLDWKRTPVVSDIHTPANLDVLIVNLIRGNLLPSACVWILGRQASVSSIPPELIDVVTDIRGFSDEMKDGYLCKRFQDDELSRQILSHYKRSPVLMTLCRQPFVCWLAATAFQRCYRYQGYGTHPPRITPFYIHVMVIQTNRKLQRYHGQSENQLKWSPKDVHTLVHLGKLALAMVEKQVLTFSQQDLKNQGLDVKETTVYSGLCTERPSLDTAKGKQYGFIHPTFQEFMAAMYLFATFHPEGSNALKEPRRGLLPPPKLPRAAGSSCSAADLLHRVDKKILCSPSFDMVLRFLCGMVSRGSHNDMLRGKLFQGATPPLTGLKEAQQLLERLVEQGPADRRPNLLECIRELTQEDE